MLSSKAAKTTYNRGCLAGGSAGTVGVAVVGVAVGIVEGAAGGGGGGGGADRPRCRRQPPTRKMIERRPRPRRPDRRRPPRTTCQRQNPPPRYH